MQQMARWLSHLSGKGVRKPMCWVRLAVATRNCSGFLTVGGGLVMLSYLGGRVRLGPACEMLFFPLTQHSMPVL